MTFTNNDILSSILNAVFFMDIRGSTSFKRPVQFFIYNGNGDAVETFLQ